MCQRDEYITSLYLLSGSISIITSGLFILFSMGDIHKSDQLDKKTEITRKNNSVGAVLPTSTLKPPEYHQMHFRKQLIL